MVTIKCPDTGQEVPTGIVMTPAEFEHAALTGNVLRCPACGRMHAWTRQEAFFREPPAGESA
jgi:hypothetical protein